MNHNVHKKYSKADLESLPKEILYSIIGDALHHGHLNHLAVKNLCQSSKKIEEQVITFYLLRIKEEYRNALQAQYGANLPFEEVKAMYDHCPEAIQERYLMDHPWFAEGYKELKAIATKKWGDGYKEDDCYKAMDMADKALQDSFTSTTMIAVSCESFRAILIPSTGDKMVHIMTIGQKSAEVRKYILNSDLRKYFQGVENFDNIIKMSELEPKFALTSFQDPNIKKTLLAREDCIFIIVGIINKLYEHTSSKEQEPCDIRQAIDVLNFIDYMTKDADIHSTILKKSVSLKLSQLEEYKQHLEEIIKQGQNADLEGFVPAMLSS